MAMLIIPRLEKGSSSARFTGVVNFGGLMVFIVINLELKASKTDTCFLMVPRLVWSVGSGIKDVNLIWNAVRRLVFLGELFSLFMNNGHAMVALKFVQMDEWSLDCFEIYEDVIQRSTS